MDLKTERAEKTGTRYFLKKPLRSMKNRRRNLNQ